MKKKYEGQGKLIEKALEKIRQEGLDVNAWNTFAPEVEVDRLECINQREEINPNDEDEMDNVPDFAVDRSSSIAVPAIEAQKLSPDFVRKLYKASMKHRHLYFTLITAAATIHENLTLHSMLKLPRSLKPPYQGLGKLFAYVHWRFQQIKGNKKPFGGMSVLAVGDFYQLPPLGKSKPLCVYEEGVLDIWKDNFQMVNLTQIMRQKDDLVFAELLNRLRVKRKMEALTDEDRALLTKTVIDIKDCPLDALHIFATNKEVDEHNRKTVAALHTDFVNIKAQDYAKDPTTDLTPDEHHAKMDGSNPKVKSRIISEDCSEDGSRSPCEESAFQLKA
ncbi:hypothetical protein D5F01_LYC24091 [Larimichthys crocea]|uniref:ATP-dependent DNA helicase n=1 Tax=Larimichthys crocea TaxID=215358 RepID=A0A6G0HFQ3_LARCR|nr:hypothetical protein D5F01_LYC24091 [Larimichthys crocea]